MCKYSQISCNVPLAGPYFSLVEEDFHYFEIKFDNFYHIFHSDCCHRTLVQTPVHSIYIIITFYEDLKVLK